MTAQVRTEPIFDALKQPLALIESDERRRVIETYIDAVRTPLDRAVFDLMSQMASAIDEQVGQHYKVRLSYQPDGLLVEVDPKALTNGEAEQAYSAEGDVEKITIRIPAELKDLAQQAASQAGTSANAWFVKALARAVKNIDVTTAPPPRGAWRDDKRHGRGARLSGWVGGDDD
jgi:hypothetical protein